MRHIDARYKDRYSWSSGWPGQSPQWQLHRLVETHPGKDVRNDWSIVKFKEGPILHPLPYIYYTKVKGKSSHVFYGRENGEIELIS